MKIFGHLIKGNVVETSERMGSFPNVEKTIQDPRILYASALKNQGSFAILYVQYLPVKRRMGYVKNKSV